MDTPNNPAWYPIFLTESPEDRDRDPFRLLQRSGSSSASTVSTISGSDKENLNYFEQEPEIIFSSKRLGLSSYPGTSDSEAETDDSEPEPQEVKTDAKVHVETKADLPVSVETELAASVAKAGLTASVTEAESTVSDAKSKLSAASAARDELTASAAKTDTEPNLELILQLGRIVYNQIKKLPQPVHNNFLLKLVEQKDTKVEEDGK